MYDGYAEEPDNKNVINLDSVRNTRGIDEYFDDANYDDYHYMDYEFIKHLEEEEKMINEILFDSTKPLQREIKRLEQGQHIIILILFLQTIALLGTWLINFS